MNFSYYPFKADKLFKHLEKFESKFVVDGEELITVFENTAEVIMLYDDHLNMVASQ